MDFTTATKKLENITKGMEYIPFITYCAIVPNPSDLSKFLIEYGILITEPDNFVLGTLCKSRKSKKWHKSRDTSSELYDYTVNSSLASLENKFNIPFISNSTPIEQIITSNIETLGSLSSGVDSLCVERLISNELEYIQSGISIGNDILVHKGGTLGAIFQLDDDDSYYCLTNQHVIANRATDLNVEKDLVIRHPSVAHTPNLVRDESSIIGEMKYEDHNSYIDLGIFKLNIENVRSGTPQNNSAFAGIESPAVGNNVSKYGLRTKYSEGKIISNNASIRMGYNDNGVRKEIIMKNQIMAQGLRADCGDSGSVVLNEKRNVIGLLMARDKGANRTFFNPIDQIFNSESGNDINNNPPFKFKCFI